MISIRQPSILFILVALAAVGGAARGQMQVLVEEGFSMHYRANGSDPGIGSSWTLEAFDDSNWPTGSFGTGYETATGAQQLIQTPVPAGTRSIYTRSTFQPRSGKCLGFPRALSLCW